MLSSMRFSNGHYSTKRSDVTRGNKIKNVLVLVDENSIVSSTMIGVSEYLISWGIRV